MSASRIGLVVAAIGSSVAAGWLARGTFVAPRTLQGSARIEQTTVVSAEACTTLAGCEARLRQLARRSTSIGISEEAQRLARDLRALGTAAWPLVAARALDPDPRMRNIAAYAIGDWTPLTEAQLPEIAAALEREPGGWPARALGRLATPSAVETLLRDIARSGGPNQSTSALAKTLPRSIPRIVEAFATADTEELTRGLEAVFRWLPPDKDTTAEAARTLVAVAATGDGASGAAALTLLLALNPNVPVPTSTLRPLLASNKPQLRDTTARVLARFGDERVLKRVLRRCRQTLTAHLPPAYSTFVSPDHLEDVLECLEPLARMGPGAANAVPLLLDRLEAVHDEIRSAILVTLGYIGDVTTVETVLNRWLGSEDDRDVTASLEALWRLDASHSIAAIDTVAASYWYEPVRIFAHRVSTALAGGDAKPVEMALEEIGSAGRLTSRHLLGFPLYVLERGEPCAIWGTPAGERFDAFDGRSRSGWRTLPLADGELAGLDRGEFGGGLWFRVRGRPERLLVDENIHAMFAAGERTAIVFGRLAHMSDAGRIIIVQAVGANAAVTRTRRLPSAPEHVRRTSGGWLVELAAGRAAIAAPDLSLVEAACVKRRD